MKPVKTLLPSAVRSTAPLMLIVLLCIVAVALVGFRDGAGSVPNSELSRARVAAPSVLTPKKVIVIRAVSTDYVSLTPRYTQAQVQSIFDNQLSTLWQSISYGNISISATVTSLVHMPHDRAYYLGTDPSAIGNLSAIMNDGVAAASSLGLDYSGASAVMVLLAEPTSTGKFYRGVENTIMLPIGSGGGLVAMPSAAFSENPTEAEPYVWGRWAHEIGHAFQGGGGPAHPSNYNSYFELMDHLLPGQSGMFEKYISGGFPGWMPPSKYTTVTITPPGQPCGGTGFVAAEELTPSSVVEAQGLVVQFSPGLYYMLSVRKKINGDQLYPIPDEGVLIERVVVGADPWVTVQGKGGNRDALWQAGDTFSAPENVFMSIASTADPNVFRINVTCQTAGQPDAFITPWLTPPLNRYETSDIWVDSICNGFGTYQYGTYIPAGDTTPVGLGNGDNPCANHDNIVHARIRNIGIQPANNVVVHFAATNPLGVGLAGASGWSPIGTVTQADFPGLASIPAGGYTDVYVHWTPVVASPPEGDFNFHSCIQVSIDPVTSASTEYNTANNTAQENFDQFYSPPAPSGTGAAINQVIHLINDSPLVTKTFSIIWTSDLPPTWALTINSGKTDIVLPPSGVQDLPVQIIPSGPRSTGQIFHVDVAASSGRLLVNPLDPTDTHFDAPRLGGLTFEVRIADPSSISLNAAGGGNAITVTGQLTPTNPFGQGKPVMIDVRGAHSIVASQLVTTDGNGHFSAIFATGPLNFVPFFLTANYMGDTTVAGTSTMLLIAPVRVYLPLIRR